jgi:Metalloenzyme superfamily
MVGHTGVIEAAVKAVETVDGCLGRVVETVAKSDGWAWSRRTTATPTTCAHDPRRLGRDKPPEMTGEKLT